MISVLCKLDVFYGKNVIDDIRTQLITLFKQKLMDLQIFKNNSELNHFIVKYNTNPRKILISLPVDAATKQQLELEVTLLVVLLSYEQNTYSKEKLESMCTSIVKIMTSNNVQDKSGAEKFLLCWDFSQYDYKFKMC